MAMAQGRHVRESLTALFLGIEVTISGINRAVEVTSTDAERNE
jgi:hypothetical protein